MEKLWDSIRNRRSVRSFDGKGLTEDAAQDILQFAQNCENPYRLPIEWKLLDANEHGLTTPVITGTECFIAGKMRRDSNLAEAYGFTFEQVVLYAFSRGIGTTWIAGTMDRPAFERAMELREDEIMPCVSPLGYPAAKMSFREMLMRKGIKADSRLPFEALFFEDAFDRPLSAEAAGKAKTALEMVRLAPSAVNKQPWRVVKQGDVFHFYRQAGKGFSVHEGWEVQRVDMGIALCHFALSMEAEGYKLEFFTDDPGISHGPDLGYIASYRPE